MTEEGRAKGSESWKAAAAARRDFKERIKAGEVYGSAALAEARQGRGPLSKIRVTTFVRYHAGWGAVRSARVMREVEISDGRRLGQLSERQARELGEALDAGTYGEANLQTSKQPSKQAT